MKNKICGIAIALIFTITVLKAQLVPMGDRGGASTVNVAPSGFITQLPLAPPQTEGDYYLENAWLRGNVLLRDSSLLEAIYFKYNLKENNFEIRTESEVKVLPGFRAKSFEWIGNQNPRDGLYINAADYDCSGTKLNSFLKVTNTGDYVIVKRGELKIIPSNYNAALNIGERNDRIVKDEAYYLLHGNKLMRVDSNKKKFTADLKIFSGHDLSSFMKENKVDPKNINDLYLVTDKLATL